MAWGRKICHDEVPDFILRHWIPALKPEPTTNCWELPFQGDFSWEVPCRLMEVKCLVLGTTELASGFRGTIRISHFHQVLMCLLGESHLEFFSFIQSLAQEQILPWSQRQVWPMEFIFQPWLCWNVGNLHPKPALMTPYNRRICKGW